MVLPKFLSALLISTMTITAAADAAEKRGHPEVFTWAKTPVIETRPYSEESLHVEYPTVFMVGERKFMLYSAYGDDGRWRIKLAIAEEGNNFVGQGNIFDESSLPFHGAYAFPFVMVSGSGEGAVYHLYFSAADGKERSKYSAIYHSSSRDGAQWAKPGKLLSDGALDPVVMEDRGGKKFIIYTTSFKSKNFIKMADLPAPNVAGKKRVLYSSPTGFYTLGKLTVSGKPMVVVETGEDWMAMCFAPNGQLVKSSIRPLLRLRNGESSQWDGLKYGMYFTDASGNPEIFYNGIRGRGVESGGQIGAGTYDVTAIAKTLDTAACQ
ncbi:hypothetical protein QRO11_18700 [Paracidovorax citrulli]|nr:hypothetical protein [Paracidovorax citrulli]WIY33948.1 hypothetical protein QRO11_18700 [Paracidovorax citrulli]